MSDRSASRAERGVRRGVSRPASRSKRGADGKALGLQEAQSGGEIVLYRAPGGKVELSVHLERDTVWLPLTQMARLFGRDKSVISRHLNNVYKSRELLRAATVAKNATVQREGGREVVREVEYFNLDAILSIGYRVNSKQGTQFRIWATQTLRDHLLRGYTLNEKRLRERGLNEVEQAIDLLSSTLRNQSLVTEQGRAVLDVVQRYTRAWRLLLEYDEDRLATSPAHPSRLLAASRLMTRARRSMTCEPRSRTAANLPIFSGANEPTSFTAFSVLSNRPSEASRCIQRRRRARRTCSTSSSRIIRSLTAISASALCCSLSASVAMDCFYARTVSRGLPTTRWWRWRCWSRRAALSKRS